MKIADNTIAAAEQYLLNNLQDVYGAREIASLTDLLFEDLLSLSKTDRFLSPEKRLSESELLQIIYACKDLKKQVPVQHITGKVLFRNLWLKVNQNVLIPRPETEELLSNIIRDHKNIASAVDCCTGSGCIALALKSAFPLASVVAVDVSQEALNVAQQNAALNNLHVDFMLQDVLSNEMPFAAESIDLIVSNPPYVLESDKQKMSLNVLQYEPHLALFVPDEDALKFYAVLTKNAQFSLKKGGMLYFEIHEEKGKDVRDLMIDHGFVDVRITKDMYDKDRFVHGKKA